LFSLIPHCFRNIIDFWIAKRGERGKIGQKWLAARAGLRVACGQKSGKIYFENPREYFRIVSTVSALFPQFRIRREGRAEVNRQNRIFLLAYARSDSGRGLREVSSEARGCLLTQRRHLAPCRKRDTIPARQRYKIFYSIQKFFSHGEGVGCLACGRWMGWPVAKYWVACGQKSGKIWVENLRK